MRAGHRPLANGAAQFNRFPWRARMSIALAMTIAEMIAAMREDNDRTVLPDAPGWMQGRTLYGGLSACLVHTAINRQQPSLPALRSMQACFVGPAEDNLSVTSRILRAGRNVTQVESTLWSGDRLAQHGIWVFGTDRPVNALQKAPIAPDFMPFSDCEPVERFRQEPEFVSNFDILRAEPKGGGFGGPHIRRWLRLKDRDGLDPISEMLALGDGLPPGAMRAMERPGPVSSINWHCNVHDPHAQTRDGWWLAEIASEQADAGYSSERLRFHDCEGRQVLSGLQSFAVFG